MELTNFLDSWLTCRIGQKVQLQSIWHLLQSYYSLLCRLLFDIDSLVAVFSFTLLPGWVWYERIKSGHGEPIIWAWRNSGKRICVKRSKTLASRCCQVSLFFNIAFNLRRRHVALYEKSAFEDRRVLWSVSWGLTKSSIFGNRWGHKALTTGG